MHILLYTANPTAELWSTTDRHENRVYVQVRSEAPPPGNEPLILGWCIGGKLNPCAPEKYMFTQRKSIV